VKGFIFHGWKWTCLHPRLRVARNWKASVTWLVLVLTDAWICHDHVVSFFVFFTNCYHKVGLPIRHLLRDLGMTHHASRFHRCGVVKTRSFRAKVSELWRKILLDFKPSFSDFLDDTKWLLKLAYLAHIYQHVSTLNTCMHPQRKHSTFHRKTDCIILVTNPRYVLSEKSLFLLSKHNCRSQWPRSLRRWSAAARLLRDCGLESHREHGCISVSVVCCQVEVSATGWSLVQRSPTDCGASCVI